MPVNPLPDIETLLKLLSASSAIAERLEAIQALAGLTESSEIIVRALLDARDSDPDADVRAEAARALRATVHQNVLRQTVALALRAELPAGTPAAISFEAWEAAPVASSNQDRWIVELFVEQAVFLNERTNERICIESKDAAAIHPFDGAPAASPETGSTPPMRRFVQVEGHTLGLSLIAYVKLMEWMDRLQAAAPAGNARRSIPRSAWVLLGLGIIQLAFPGTLSPFWGGAWVLLGAANIALPPRQLILINPLVVALTGMWYILFAGPGLSLIGYGPGIWGTLRVVDYMRNR
jgi:hypothetical protein